MSEMTTKLKNIERFEDLELGSIRILNSAIAYLTQVESELAALKSRLEEAERELAKVSDMASTYKAAYTGAKTVLDSLGYEISFNGEEDITGRGAQVDGGEG